MNMPPKPTISFLAVKIKLQLASKVKDGCYCSLKHMKECLTICISFIPHYEPLRLMLSLYFSQYVRPFKACKSERMNKLIKIPIQSLIYENSPPG